MSAVCPLSSRPVLVTTVRLTQGPASALPRLAPRAAPQLSAAPALHLRAPRGMRVLATGQDSPTPVEAAQTRLKQVDQQQLLTAAATATAWAALLGGAAVSGATLLGAAIRINGIAGAMGFVCVQTVGAIVGGTAFQGGLVGSNILGPVLGGMSTDLALSAGVALGLEDSAVTRIAGAALAVATVGRLAIILCNINQRRLDCERLDLEKKVRDAQP